MSGTMSFQAFLGHLSDAVRPGEAEMNPDGMIRIGPERDCGISRVAFYLTGKNFETGQWTGAARVIKMDEGLARKIIKVFDSKNVWAQDQGYAELEVMRREIMIAVKLNVPKVEPIQTPKRLVGLATAAGVCLLAALIIVL